MNPDAFRTWRKALGLKQKDAAEKLGLKKRVIQYYEKGNRDGKNVEIPKTVELSCLALSLGIETYDGRGLPRTASELLAARNPRPDA
ncbi:helix-turn-helix transcriptional regulator [Aurantimonas sp. A2-1-M11]|uniref:helix-turn-helix domain-containing protein n=1 Tax=Aurantimonas sp. A2-1-M11 TaxID=3113712 RepID=UPI002F94B67B